MPVAIVAGLGPVFFAACAILAVVVLAVVGFVLVLVVVVVVVIVGTPDVIDYCCWEVDLTGEEETM